MSAETDYWEECVAIGAEECGLELTIDQLKYVAESVVGGHDNYGLAFYSPPDSERISQINKEWQDQYKALEKEFDKYRANAETAVKKALNQYDTALVSIGDHGEVFRSDGRTTRIQ